MAEALASTAAGCVALPALASLVGIARVATTPAMVVIGLGIDAVPPADLPLGAGALPIDAGQRIGARIVAAAAVILVVARVDAELVAEDLISGTARLALSVHTGAAVTAALAAAATMQGVALGVDALLAALDGALLAPFLIVLLALLLFGL